MEIIFEDYNIFVRCSRAETILWIILWIFLVIFSFRAIVCFCLFLFRFLVDDPSQLGRKVGKTGFIYPCLSRTCTRILDLMFVFLILVGSIDTFVRVSDVEKKIFLMMFLVK